MIGTPEQPWINTDQYVNLPQFHTLRSEILRGIALSVQTISQYGNLYDSSQRDCSFWHRYVMQLAPDHPDRISYMILENNYTGFARQTAKRRWLKMVYGAASGGNSVILRVEDNYLCKNHESHCRDTDNAALFPGLMEYLRALPFSGIGRALFFVNDYRMGTPIHTDHLPSSHTNDFFWFSLDGTKEFFLLDQETKKRHYITSTSAFFDEQAWHGSDPSERMAISLRVDGVFTDEFKKQLGLYGLANYR